MGNSAKAVCHNGAFAHNPHFGSVAIIAIFDDRYINVDDVIEEIVDTIKGEYKKNILNMYFKSPYKKKREEEWKNELYV